MIQLETLQKKFGAKAHPNSEVSGVIGGVEVHGFVIDGFQHVPATEYHNGVDMAIVLYGNRRIGLPQGYYRWSLITPRKIESIGDHRVIHQFFNESGDLVVESEEDFQVHSLTPTDNKAARNSRLEIRAESVQRKDNGSFEFRGWDLRNRCSNGGCPLICQSIDCGWPCEEQEEDL